MSSRGVCCALGSTLALLLSLSARPAAQAPTLADYRWVKDLIRTAFPELNRHRYRMEFVVTTDVDTEAWGPGVKVVVWRSRAEEPPSLDDREVLLSGYFEGPPRSPDDSVTFTLPRASAAILDAIERHALSVPDLSPAAAFAELDRAGAKYPPDRRDAFLRHLEVERFEGVFGNIDKADVDFVWQRPEAADRGQPRVIVMRWVVRLSTTGRDGRANEYVLSFEPLAGSLVAVTKVK